MFLQMNAFSKALGHAVQVNILVPQVAEGETYKTLWLLHGLTDGHTAWMRYSSIERYAAQHKLAVVMPNADRSWYTDTAYGAKYFTYITEELPTLLQGCFKGMSAAREDTLVAGLSMGGYGALKMALTLPERYGACIALSASPDITRKERAYDLTEWQGLFGYTMPSAAALGGSEHDVFALAAARAAEGCALPKMYLWCGTEDSLIGINRDYHAHLTTLGVAHRYEESQGDHSWKWWDMHIQNGLQWALEEM